ncbi:hypothetical protein ISS05_01325 [Candidatus Woesearchaeota archaeon]|nr:hypothetical protein [Candidatus Woesearchaeota archaeon]
MGMDKSEKIKKFMVFFMAFVMIGSIFGVMFFGYNEETNEVKYNDLVFVQKQDLWSTKLDNKEVAFNYLPDDTKDISLGNDVSDRLVNALEIDLTSEFNDSFKEQIALAEHYLTLTLDNLNIYVRMGFTAENEYGMDVITCEDSIPTVPVIYFREGNETKVYLENNCIIAEAEGDFDILRIKDLLLYYILGILK